MRYVKVYNPEPNEVNLIVDDNKVKILSRDFVIVDSQLGYKLYDIMHGLEIAPANDDDYKNYQSLTEQRVKQVAAETKKKKEQEIKWAEEEIERQKEKIKLREEEIGKEKSKLKGQKEANKQTKKK